MATAAWDPLGQTSDPPPWGMEAGEHVGMRALVVVDGGICGFQTTIHADSEDSQNVAFRIESGCEKVASLAEALTRKGPVDAYMEIGAGSGGVVLTTSNAVLKGCCAGCAVHAGTFKAMQVAAGLALPKDVTLTVTSDR